MKEVIYNDLGLINYKDAWDLQQKLFEDLIEAKKLEKPTKKQYILLCEHKHVFTLGKSGKQTNLLVNEVLLKQKGIDFYQIDRGGDITYHGPGQLVIYPILDLDEYSINTREYVLRLEEAVIQTLQEFSIVSTRLEGAAGIWIKDRTTDYYRKICAIGVKSSHRVTMHGIALNINTDLSYFELMNPCGFTDKGTTSICKELGNEIDMEKVKANLTKKLDTILLKSSK